MRKIIAALIILWVSLGSLIAQEVDPLIFPCLGDPASLILKQTYPRRVWPFPLSEWAAMSEQITGRTIWIGEERGGFDMPDNALHRYTVFGKRTDGTTFEVWLYDSRDTDDWYLLMMDDTQTDYHCRCGAWAVDEETMAGWLHPILFDWFVNQGSE
jgi:hypothetical protein